MGLNGCAAFKGRCLGLHLASARRGGSVGAAMPNGTKRASPAINGVDATTGGAIGAARSTRLSPRPSRHLRTRLAFSPWASATADIDAPGSSQPARTLALSSALCWQRGADLECIGVHQSNRWTPSSGVQLRYAMWDGWPLTLNAGPDRRSQMERADGDQAGAALAGG